MFPCFSLQEKQAAAVQCRGRPPRGGDPRFGSPTGRTWEWRQGKRRHVCVCVCVVPGPGGALRRGNKANRDVCVLSPDEVLRGAREGERLLPSKEGTRGEELKNHSEPTRRGALDQKGGWQPS